MCRIASYELLLLTVAAVVMTGCSDPPSPEVAHSTDMPVDIVLPDASEAIPLTGGVEGVAPSASAAVEEATAEIAEEADSDTPGDYKRPPAGSGKPHEHVHPPSDSPTTGGVKAEAPKRNGRLADGDDPKAPLIVAKVVEEQGDSPLNDGRNPAAKPLPEGQRAEASPSEAAESLDSGRAPGAKPGDERTVSETPQTKPSTKPAAPTRKTLADLAESIQELDKDDDGQLGLYEWPREKLAEFKTLDADKDGFLSPAELVAGQKKAEANSPQSDTKAAAGSTDKAKEAAPTKTDDSKEKATEASPDKSDSADDSKSDNEDESKDEASKDDEESGQPEEEKTSAAETDEKEATSDTSADEADSEDKEEAEDESE